MGYSDHTDLGGHGLAYEAHPKTRAGGFSALNWLAMGAVVLLWALFAITAAVSPETLTDIWAEVETLPFAVRIVVWVVALPWMLAIAIWQGSWPDLARFSLIAALAVASLWTFYPSRSS
ncbi:MAG TPA: hypothetical protein VFZ15_01380 [Acidimicrobiia bacterium]|nr:hypothetical protein [Acidimicrobiia bacterium]